MILGEKESVVPQKVGSPDQGDKREREGEREKERKRTEYRTFHKENTSPKPLMGKMGGVDYCKFAQTAEIKE